MAASALLLGWIFHILRQREVIFLLCGLCLGLSVWYMGAGQVVHRTIWMRSNGLYYRTAPDSGSGRYCNNGNRKQDIYFLKVHRTGGSTTVANLFVRHARKNRLTLGRTTGPVKGWLGWPKPMSPEHLWKASVVRKNLTSGDRLINVIATHSVYNRETIRAVMPADTASVGILREPFSHFLSIFDHYQLNDEPKLAKMKKSDAMKVYLEHPERHEKTFLGGKRVRNFQFTEFGYLNEDVTNLSAINSYIKYLDDNFLEVIIAEHFNESLILMRRLLCWKMEDIIFLSFHKNHRRPAVHPGTQRHRYLHRLHKRWSSADHLLYNHFNQTLWQKIKYQGPSFHTELKYYKLLLKDIGRFCAKNAEGDFYMVSALVGADLLVKKSNWTDVFIVTKAKCEELSRHFYANVDLFVNKVS